MTNINRHYLINDFIDYIKYIRKYSKHTIRSYSYDLDEYYQYFINNSKKEFLELDHIFIRSYLQHVSKSNLNAKTLARRLATLKSFYKYIFNNNHLKVNVAKFIRAPKTNSELPHYLTIKEIESVLDLPVGYNLKALRERLILQLFYVTGIRLSELIKIKIIDINLKECVIRIMGKRNKERIVIYGNDTKQTIDRYINALDNNNSYLFPALRNIANNKHISSKTVYNIVKKYLKIVSNNEKLSPHSLRHTFATHMLDRGADILAIKKLLGHSSLSSTQIYTHLQPEKIKKIYDKAHADSK